MLDSIKCQVWLIPVNLASSCLDTLLRHSLSISLSFFYNVWNAWDVKEASKNWSKGKFVEYASTLCPENINIYFYFQTAAGLAHKGRWIHVYAACFTAVSQSKSRMGRRSKRCNPAFRELSGGKNLSMKSFSLLKLSWEGQRSECYTAVCACVRGEGWHLWSLWSRRASS